MPGYGDSFDGAVHDAFCEVTRAGIAAGLIFTAFTATTVAGAVGGLAVAGGSAYLYNRFCDRPPPPPPYGEPQDWEGGQCDDVQYTVNLTASLYLFSNGNRVPVGDIGQSFSVTGAISFIDIVKEPDNFNETRAIIVAKVGSINIVFHPGETNDDINPVWDTDNYRIEVTRNDGLPDICGDPPPVMPPDGFSEPGDFTYINDEGDTINVPVTFDFRGARIGINGNIFIPVGVRFSFDPTLNFTGNLNINTGDFILNVGDPRAPIGDGDNPGDVVMPPGAPPEDPPGLPPAPPPEPPPEPSDKPRKVIRGVLVTSILPDELSTVIFQDDIPDIYAPSLGYVSFLCQINGVLAWTADIPVKNRKQIIECPWRYGAIDVKGSPKTGAQFSLKPVYDINSYSSS